MVYPTESWGDSFFDYKYITYQGKKSVLHECINRWWNLFYKFECLIQQFITGADIARDSMFYYNNRRVLEYNHSKIINIGNPPPSTLVTFKMVPSYNYPTSAWGAEWLHPLETPKLIIDIKVVDLILPPNVEAESTNESIEEDDESLEIDMDIEGGDELD